MKPRGRGAVYMSPAEGQLEQIPAHWYLPSTEPLGSSTAPLITKLPPRASQS